LGGAANFEADRVFAEQAMERWPLIRSLAVANRRYLGRVVDAALDAGITQFLDLGAGLPTVGAVHEIVDRRLGAGAGGGDGHAGRVVYVDNDPIAYAHMEIMLDETVGSGFVEWVAPLAGDLCRPSAILDHPKTRHLIDFKRPVCVLMVAILHFVGPDADVPALIRRYRQPVAPGSWLAISHVAVDAAPDAAEAAQVRDLADFYQRTPTPVYVRDRAEINGWFSQWGELLSPGLVHLTDWRPEQADLNPAAAQAGPFSWCAVSETDGREMEGGAKSR